MVMISVFFPTFLQPWWDICFFFIFSAQIAFIAIHIKQLFRYKKHEYVFINRIDIRPPMSKEIKELPKRIFPNTSSFDLLFFKCIHCENIITLPPHLLKSLPKSMAMCPCGIRVKIKELITGSYDCLLEE